MRDLLGGGIFVDTCHEELTTRDESNQLTILTQIKVADTFEILLDQLLLRLVINNFNIYPLRLTSNALGIDFTHIAIAQQSIVSHAQEAHRMRLEVGYRLHLFKVVGRSFIDIETSIVALAQEHNILIARQVSRIPVFTHVGREDGMRLFLSVVVYHITRHRGHMVLSPNVLAAFAVVVKERLAILVE